MQPFPPGPPHVTNNPLTLLRYARGFSADPLGFVGGRFAQYGDLYATVFRGVPLYVTRHPEHIHDALVTHGQSMAKPEKGFGARQLRRFLGTGLVNSNGDFWRRQRRMINPAFGRRQIEALGEVMVRRTEALGDQWPGGPAVLEVGQEMMGLTLGIVAKTLFDHDASGQQDRIANALEQFRNFSGAASILPDWVPLPSVRRVNRALSDVNDVVYGLIDSRRKEDDDALGRRTDLLSALLLATDTAPGARSGERMTREELRDELLTLFLAGHETTSQALTWTWYLLSQHPEIEARLHAELADVLGGRSPTPADALPYTDAVLQESMRLFPPVTTLARVTTAPIELGGYSIPEGADVICWVYFAHHDARWWPEPERFDPTRFLPGRVESIPRGAYTPFGAGQRQCIGKHFALMEARLLLATLAQRFRLSLVPGHPVAKHVAVTMSPKHGMKMRVQRR